jgi:ribonuclease HIII
VPIAEKYAPDSIKKDDIYANYFFRMVPYSILIDKSGKIVGQWRGYSKENEEGLDKKLSELFLVN